MSKIKMYKDILWEYNKSVFYLHCVVLFEMKTIYLIILTAYR